MTPEERVELAVHRTRARMIAQFPQNMDVLQMLEYLGQELAKLSADNGQLGREK
jgi:hypothetical protein